MGHAGSSSLTIAAQHIFDGADMRGPGSVRISQGRIESITFGEVEAPASIHPSAVAILAPGFIDIQVTVAGAFFSTTSQRRLAFDASLRRTARRGPRLLADPHHRSQRAHRRRLAAVAQACLKIPGVLGFHLEGPALNRSRKGIHPEAEIRVPESARSRRDQKFGGRGRSILTLAPECCARVHDR